MSKSVELAIAHAAKQCRGAVTPAKTVFIAGDFWFNCQKAREEFPTHKLFQSAVKQALGY